MACRLCRERPGATAVFAANDAIAIGVLKASIEGGVSIPRDLALVGFDDVEPAAIAHQPLTTIHQAKYELGEAALNILLKSAADKTSAPEHRVLSVKLVERESAGKPRK